ncbi:rhodanese-like domain-containing protein, partial [Pseudomonas sp. 79_C]
MVANLIQFATNHYILVAIFVVLLVALLVNEIRRGGQSLSNGQLTALVNADKALVIDIRPAKEYSAGHIVGALNIPQDKLA